MQTIFIPTWLSVTVLLALLNQGVWKKCVETFFFRAVKCLSLTKQQMLVSLDGIWFGEVGNASPTIIIRSCQKKITRSAFNDQNTLIIDHLLLHLLPRNTLLEPVFLNKLRDWPCTGHCIQCTSGTWARRNPGHVNHSSLNTTRMELGNFWLAFGISKNVSQQQNASHEPECSHSRLLC